MEVVRLMESDLRIQVVFTSAPDVFSNGVKKFIEGLGVVWLPWQQALHESFDLAITASLGAVHEIRAPLIVMSHGARFNKLVPRQNGAGARGSRETYGLDAQRLVHDGVVVPSAIVLSHRADLVRLGRSCPEALPAAVVVGDPCFDRLSVNMARRPLYRRALAVRSHQKLVVVSSTWGSQSLFGRRSDLLSRLVAELPADEFRVVALFHPHVWFGHGIWQIRTWLADCQRRGLSVLPPEADWRAVLIAADWVIGDHGSATLYGAATGVPVMLAGFPAAEVDPESAPAELAALAPRITRRRPLRAQLARVAAEFQPDHHRRLAELVTSVPGRFDRNMRQLMYRLLDLRQPAVVPGATPIPVPFLVK
ncbi:hypothetical protein MBA17_05340 [Streptosporangium sp. KLBMP 9127]|nr:hypothetical protein [Streptosporangium sp. KLBMP 9127]